MLCSGERKQIFEILFNIFTIRIIIKTRRSFTVIYIVIRLVNYNKSLKTLKKMQRNV